MALALELLADGSLELLLLRRAEALPVALQRLSLDGREDAGRLLAPHDGGAGIRPLKQESRAVGAAAHGIVAGSEAAADDHGVLGHRRPGQCGHELGAVLCNAAGFRGLSDHEAGDVLQKHERYALTAAEFDEVRT